MVATFLGVLAAFGLEHWASNRRDNRARRALETERQQLINGLIASVESTLPNLNEVNDVDTWEEALIVGVFLPSDFWHAVRHRLIEVGVDPETVAHFADFYHYVDTIGALLRKASAGNDSLRLYQQMDYTLDWALDVGYDVVRKWGDEKAKQRFPWPRPEVKPKPTPGHLATGP